MAKINKKVIIKNFLSKGDSSHHEDSPTEMDPSHCHISNRYGKKPTLNLAYNMNYGFNADIQFEKGFIPAQGRNRRDGACLSTFLPHFALNINNFL